MNEWIRELEEGGKYSHLLDAHSCSIIIRFFLSTSHDPMVDVMRWIDIMISRGIEPDVVILTDLLCKQGMSEGIHILSKVSLCGRFNLFMTMMQLCERKLKFVKSGFLVVLLDQYLMKR